MRIAVFIKRTTFHKGYGGLETQNKILCEGLAERGHDITVFSPQLDLGIEKKTEKGVDYVFIPCVFRSLFSNITKRHWYKMSYKTLLEYTNSQPFDLIISQSSGAFGIIKHKKEMGTPVISIAHGSTLMEFKTRTQNIFGIRDAFKLLPDTFYTIYNLLFKQRFFIKNSDVVIAVSNFVAKSLSFETWSSKSKFVVINNGIDPTKFESIVRVYKELSDDSELSSVYNFLYLGQIQKSKGLDYLLKIVEDLVFKNIHMDIVGDGNYLERFKNKIAKKELSSFFTFHGKVEYDKVVYFYNRAYAFLFPTNRYEGFPMVLVEAMFNSLPIIAFNKGGVSDAVVDKETGYLIRPGNLKKFKKSILQILNNPDIKNSMGSKSLEKAQKDFTIEHMLNRYEKVFEEISR